jgi:microcystin-dependent protein
MVAIQSAGGNASTAASLKCTAKAGNIITLQNMASPPFPPADTTQSGLLNKLSGAATDYVGGDNATHPLASAFPAGMVSPFAGANAPTGWLLCDGSAQLRTAYAALFAVIGTIYGPGDGSTTFNLPDGRGRTLMGVGQGTGLTQRNLADVGGEENHQLSIAELAVHTHLQTAHNHSQNSHSHTDSGHQHTTQLYQRTDVTIGGGSGAANISAVGTSSPVASSIGAAAIAAATATNVAVAAVNQNTGSGTGHNTVPPFLALNYIIKT